MIARGPEGASLIAMVADIQQKSRAICDETVSVEYLGINVNSPTLCK